MDRMTPARKKFRDETTCPKCGTGNAAVAWCSPGHRRRCVDDGEHLHRTCARCGYGWLEAPLDAEESK